MSLYRAMELLASLICQNKPRNCCLFITASWTCRNSCSLSITAALCFAELLAERWQALGARSEATTAAALLLRTLLRSAAGAWPRLQRPGPRQQQHSKEPMPVAGDGRADKLTAALDWPARGLARCVADAIARVTVLISGDLLLNE